MIDIKESRNGDVLEIILTGRLDTNTAPQVETVLKEDVKAINKLIFDLSGITYISSAGLRVVLVAHKLMATTRGKFIVKNPSSFCKQVLEATGMDGVLTIE